MIYTAEGTEYKRQRVWPSFIPFIVLVVSLTVATIAATRKAKDKPQESTNGGFVISQGVVNQVDWTTQYAEARAKEDAARLGRELTWRHRPHLNPPPDAPPSTIKVGPYRYRVHYTSKPALDSQNAYCLTVIEDREFWFNPSRAANMRDDVLHELLHAARDLGTGDGRFAAPFDSEENAIQEISPSLLQIMRDNPSLLKWILQQ